MNPQHQKSSPEHGEHGQSPEWRPQLVDLEHIEPEQVDTLVSAIGLALGQSIHNEREYGTEDPGSAKYDQMLHDVAQDTQHLIDSNLEKATKVFAKLVQSRSPWARQFALDDMAGELLRRQPEDLPGRQWLLEQWVAQLNVGPEDVDADDDHVRKAAEQTLSDVVRSDWLDEPTARYLNGELPSHSQRHE